MNTNEIARIAALVGEPARTGMLLALMDGRALTANELAGVGNVSPATASRHLALLVQAGLLQVAQQGRHRYHRLASPQVAQMLEGIMQLAQPPDPATRRTLRPGPRDEAMRWARSCYDHLAGRLGVAITEHLLDERAIVFDGEAGHLTDRSGPTLQRLGLDAGWADAAPATKRVHCRPCLDWSERRFHVAGQLGAMVCAHCIDQGWLLRRPGTRALVLTARGGVALRGWLGQARWDGLASLAVVTADGA